LSIWVAHRGRDNRVRIATTKKGRRRGNRNCKWKWKKEVMRNKKIKKIKKV
jgi:hypothetical protein